MGAFRTRWLRPYRVETAPALSAASCDTFACTFGPSSLVCSDMNVMVWDTSIEDAVVQCARHHTEFAVGVDFRLFRPGVLASCGWDGAVWVWDYTRGPPTVGPSPRSPVPGPANGAGAGAGGGGSAGAGGGAGVAPGASSISV